MRITHEADYAVRILAFLANTDQVVGAKEISARTGVTQRFTLKILHKLIGAAVVESFRGASGGYRLKRRPAELSLGEVIEIIDGPIQINHCLEGGYDCTRVEDKTCCQFHHVFRDVNRRLRADLYDITMERFCQAPPEKDSITVEQNPSHKR